MAHCQFPKIPKQHSSTFVEFEYFGVKIQWMLKNLSEFIKRTDSKSMKL